MQTSKIEAAIHEAGMDVTMDYLGAGYQIAEYRDGRWNMSDELDARTARKARAAAMARRALEIMGHDPLETVAALATVEAVGSCRQKIVLAMKAMPAQMRLAF